MLIGINDKINFNNGKYAICCDIFTNKIEFYYIDSDSIFRDIVIGYCNNLDDVNSIIAVIKEIL